MLTIRKQKNVTEKVQPYPHFNLAFYYVLSKLVGIRHNLGEIAAF